MQFSTVTWLWTSFWWIGSNHRHLCNWYPIGLEVTFRTKRPKWKIKPTTRKSLTVRCYIPVILERTGTAGFCCYKVPFDSPSRSWCQTISALCKVYFRKSPEKEEYRNSTFAPHHDKTNTWYVRTAKTQISLSIRPDWLVFAVRSMGRKGAKDPVWSESSLVAHVILFVLSCCGSFYCE